MEFSSNNSGSSSNSLCFNAEWYQEDAGIVRLFIISFYPCDQSIEVSEQSKKTFLRRTKVPGLNIKDFFIGSNVNIFGRLFNIIDYADKTTKNQLSKNLTRTFMLLKPSITSQLGKILTCLEQSEIGISKCMMVTFYRDLAQRFLNDENEQEVNKAEFMDELLSGPSIGIVAIGDNVFNKLLALKGLRALSSLNLNAHPLLSKLFEEEDIKRGIYCSKSSYHVEREISLFFNSENGLNLPTYQNTTLLLIKPHALKEGKLGSIISETTNRGFKINALKTLLMERTHCEEFYEVYRGVVPEYVQMVAELASGVCMALEIGSKDRSIDTCNAFREFSGPTDPDVARLLYPNSLRARFGTSKIKNAIHCTDLQEDTVLEIQYMFKILTEY